MLTTREVPQAIRDDAWAALAVTSMNVEDVDALLAEKVSRDILAAGISYGTSATLTYLRDRGWLNTEKMSAEVTAE